MKRKTKIRDAFLDDMGLDSSAELALANVNLNEQVLKSITFDDVDPLEGSSSTTTNVNLGLGIELDGGESNGNGGDFDDYDMEENGEESRGNGDDFDLF